jgi:hypothetical protein
MDWMSGSDVVNLEAKLVFKKLYVSSLADQKDKPIVNI